MSTWRLLAPLAVLAVAAPAAAQFSDAYKFIKAVRDKDAATATKILDMPGTTLVNVADGQTGDRGLHIAVKRRDLQWIGFLLQRGANASLRDREGSTPLLLAATTGFSDAVEIFVRIRSPLDAQNRLGETALMKAVQARDATSTRLLLEGGANPDLTDSSGASARTMAAADGRGGPVARLLKVAPARAARPAQGPSL